MLPVSLAGSFADGREEARTCGGECEEWTYANELDVLHCTVLADEKNDSSEIVQDSDCRVRMAPLGIGWLGYRILVGARMSVRLETKHRLL